MIMLVRFGGAGAPPAARKLFSVEGNGPLVGDTISIPAGSPGAQIRNVTGRTWAVRTANGEGGTGGANATPDGQLNFILVIDTD